MAHASVSTAKSRPAIDSSRSFQVIDVIEIKASYKLGVAPGVVLVLQDFRPEELRSVVGQIALVRTLMGDHWLAEVEGVRDHGSSVSIHLAGLGPNEIPVGSIVHFPLLTGPAAERLRLSLGGSAEEVRSDLKAKS